MEPVEFSVVRGTLGPVVTSSRGERAKLRTPADRTESHHITKSGTVTVDEVYRGYRIATKLDGGWTARITHVRGPYVPLDAKATLAEGEERCVERARAVIDRYVAFLEQNDLDGEPN